MKLRNKREFATTHMELHTMTSPRNCGTTLLLIALWSCAAPPPANAEDDREKLLARVEQFNDAIREGDVQKYADVFVDDFVFTWSRDGQIYAPDSIFPNVVPTPDHRPIVDEIIVRTYGNSAIVNCRMRQRADENGSRTTFSFARVNGVWKVIASHSTPITPPAG